MIESCPDANFTFIITCYKCAGEMPKEKAVLILVIPKLYFKIKI